MKKQPKITNKMQKVAVDILQELEIYMMGRKEVPEEIMQIYKKMYDKYELCDDPFTGMCCTLEEYCKNSLEYDKQLMDMKFGHHDGLD